MFHKQVTKQQINIFETIIREYNMWSALTLIGQQKDVGQLHQTGNGNGDGSNGNQEEEGGAVTKASTTMATKKKEQW